MRKTNKKLIARNKAVAKRIMTSYSYLAGCGVSRRFQRDAMLAIIDNMDNHHFEGFLTQGQIQSLMDGSKSQVQRAFALFRQLGMIYTKNVYEYSERLRKTVVVGTYITVVKVREVLKANIYRPFDLNLKKRSQVSSPTKTNNNTIVIQQNTWIDKITGAILRDETKEYGAFVPQKEVLQGGAL